MQNVLKLRRVDPGGILHATDVLLGGVTKWTVLGDNVIGAWGWREVDLDQQYRAVTHGAGAFIASAMCYLEVSGSDAGALLDALSPRRVSDLPLGSARFVLFTTPAGTVDEEAVVVRTGPEEFLLSCGGGKEPGWLRRTAEFFTEVRILPSEVFSFNIKGPKRLQAVQSLVDDADRRVIADLRNFQSCQVRTLVGGQARVLRSVIGYEVWTSAEVLAAMWRQLVTERPEITPCGWELLTIYRMECRDITFGLFPVDVHIGTTLFEIGAGWMVPDDHDGRDYIGREGLLKSRGSQRLWLAGLHAADTKSGCPLVGDEVLDDSGGFLGYVTSAAPSPREGRVLAFAHLAPDCQPGAVVHAAGSRWQVSTIPFPDLPAAP